jgi:hypothetical protein
MEQSSSWEANGTLNYSRTFQSFMKPEGLLPWTAATSPYHEPEESNPHPPNLYP